MLRFEQKPPKSPFTAFRPWSSVLFPMIFDPWTLSLGASFVVPTGSHRGMIERPLNPSVWIFFDTKGINSNGESKKLTFPQFAWNRVPILPPTNGLEYRSISANNRTASASKIIGLHRDLVLMADDAFAAWSLPYLEICAVSWAPSLVKAIATPSKKLYALSPCCLCTIWLFRTFLWDSALKMFAESDSLSFIRVS